jgi:hypothetical protein
MFVEDKLTKSVPAIKTLSYSARFIVNKSDVYN